MVMAQVFYSCRVPAASEMIEYQHQGTSLALLVFLLFGKTRFGDGADVPSQFHVEDMALRLKFCLDLKIIDERKEQQTKLLRLIIIIINRLRKILLLKRSRRNELLMFFQSRVETPLMSPVQKKGGEKR